MRTSKIRVQFEAERLQDLGKDLLRASTGSQPKERIAACPLCVLPRKPSIRQPTTLNTPPDNHHDLRATILIPICQAIAVRVDFGCSVALVVS
jgi:hypothetical protein